MTDQAYFSSSEVLNIDRLPIEKRVQSVTMLVEGMSMGAVSRVADVSINTVTKMLADVGQACADFQDQALRDLTLTNVQVDEIWAFICAKQKNVPADTDPTLGLGNCYTYKAIDRDIKLMPCYMQDYRTAECAEQFMQDLAAPLNGRIQLTPMASPATLPRCKRLSALKLITRC
jgi:hypothetical protein